MADDRRRRMGTVTAVQAVESVLVPTIGPVTARVGVVTALAGSWQRVPDEAYPASYEVGSGLASLLGG